MVALADLASPTPNSLATGPFGSAVGSKHFRDAGVPLIRGSNLSLDVGTRLLDNEIVYLSGDKANEFRRSQAVRGDLVFTCWGTVGQVGFLDKRARYDRYIVSNKQMKLTPDLSKVHPLYLYYALSSPAAVAAVRSIAIGSSVPGFNLGQLRHIMVPLPTIPEQRAIAAVLGALDAKIEANNGVSRACAELAAARFVEAADAVVLLSGVATIIMGQSPPGESYNECGEGMPFFQGIRDFGARHPKRRVWCTAPTRMAQPQDTLVSVRAPVGAVNVAMEMCAIGRGLAAARNPTSPGTLYQALTADPTVWVPYESEGTVFGSINKLQLSQIQVPWPRANQAGELEKVLSILDGRLLAAERESQVLAQLRDVLLPRLLSGELRVRDAEALVEEVV
jgi:type I restriction enzyme S subunit